MIDKVESVDRSSETINFSGWIVCAAIESSWSSMYFSPLQLQVRPHKKLP